MDLLDMRILGRLLNDCREPDRQIGKKLGVSGGAVRARIQKMEKTGVIEGFVTRVEPPVLGCGILYVVVSGQNVAEILEQVRKIGRPFFVAPCIGGITVCSIVVEGNARRKMQLAGKMASDARVLSMFEAGDAGLGADFTRTDLDVLGRLVSDPRQKIEQVAKGARISTKTVTRCIEKLHKSGGVQFTLVYDPKKMEGFIPHVVLAWIDGDFKAVLARLNARFSKSYLQVPFIAKDQIVLFMYSDSIFGMDRLAQGVGSVKGVRSTELFIPKKILFYTEWIKKAVLDSKKSPKLHIRYRAD